MIRKTIIALSCFMLASSGYGFSTELGQGGIEVNQLIAKSKHTKEKKKKKKKDKEHHHKRVRHKAKAEYLPKHKIPMEDRA